MRRLTVRRCVRPQSQNKQTDAPFMHNFLPGFCIPSVVDEQAPHRRSTKVIQQHTQDSTEPAIHNGVHESTAQHLYVFAFSKVPHSSQSNGNRATLQNFLVISHVVSGYSTTRMDTGRTNHESVIKSHSGAPACTQHYSMACPRACAGMYLET